MVVAIKVERSYQVKSYVQVEQACDDGHSFQFDSLSQLNKAAVMDI